MIVGEAAELLGREVAARDLDLDGAEALLALALDVRGAEAVELGEVAVRRAERTGGVGRAGLLVVQEQAVDRREVALVDPVALQLLLDEVAHRLDADLVDHHLQAGAGAVDAQPVLAVEDPQDGLGVLEVLAVVGARRSRSASARCAA